jgi:hypothetical protein
VSQTFQFANKHSWHFIISFVTIVAYTIAFLVLHPVVGNATAVLVVLPVAAAGLLFGVRAGLVAGLLALPLNTLLLNMAGETGLAVIWHIGEMPMMVATIIIGATVGWIHDAQATKNRILEDAQAINRELDAILDMIPDVLFRLDKRGNILDYRKGQDAILKLDNSICGQHYADVLPEEIVAVIVNHPPATETKTTIQHGQYHASPFKS